MHATVSSRQNMIEVYFRPISTIEMIFCQSHVPTNELIHKYIDHIYAQMEIACNVLFLWNDVIEQRRLQHINTNTKSMVFQSY